MKRMNGGIVVAILFLELFFAGCENPAGSSEDNQTVTIESRGWIFTNYAYGFSGRYNGAYVTIELNFAEDDLVAEDFRSVKIEAPDGCYWLYDDTASIESRFDESISQFTLSNGYNSTTQGILPIGNWTATATLKNGSVSTYTVFIAAPGSLTAGGYSKAYSPEVASSSDIDSNCTPLPKQATGISASYDAGAGELTVDFSIDDSRVYGGYLWLYDGTGDYIGNMANRFRDYDTSIVPSYLNNGVFYNDGTPNRAVVLESDLSLYSGYDLSDVAAVSVVLTDGAQYTSGGNLNWGWDSRSVSGLANVTTSP